MEEEKKTSLGLDENGEGGACISSGMADRDNLSPA